MNRFTQPKLWTFEVDVDPATVEEEDRGAHLIAYGLGADNCPLYVHLLSESPTGDHSELRSLVGKRIRVTIEVIEGMRVHL